MSNKKITKHPLILLRTSINTLFNHPIILVPFSILAFIQIFFLEIMFFAPRYPLSKIFKPFIIYLHGEPFLHYPFNFIVLVKWYHHWIFQFPIFAFLTSFFIGATVTTIHFINNEKTIRYRTIFKITFNSYVHIVVAGILSVSTIFGLLNLYSLLLKRASIIRSTTGIFFIMKQIIEKGAPYFQFFAITISTTLFAFVIPIIIIEKKKIFKALFLNFKYLFKSFFFILIVVFIPMLIYVPIHLLKTNTALFEKIFFPEMSLILIVFSIIFLLFIDAIQFTAITIFYMLKKEEK